MPASTSLCLACSSSLPPRPHDPVFTTKCCSKPICTNCITTNPRLARYNPCLACLGGAEAVGSWNIQQKLVGLDKVNIDGAVRDEDTFALGGDDEDDDDEEENLDEQGAPPPPYLEHSPSGSSQLDESPSESQSNDGRSSFEYHIQRGDTLNGIALKFAVDPRELCKLNKFSPSILSTTPHLLHTRTVLLLPPSARTSDKTGNSLIPSKASNDAQDRLRAVRRERERAEKRLQTIAKEMDWRIAKAYVALAEDENIDEVSMQHDLKQKENVAPTARTGSAGPSSTLDMIALDRYLEDDEWETRERRDGRLPIVPSIPLLSQKENPVGKWFSWK
ncbi:hypothetical protein D9757_001416 [Collybiopsis confluens]|uniref:LysM domain-containing protein n=1 Tax=Collybiopsis confluens TaxID=2823264 RepID=A0A8H5MFL4_9AGAR|nr:hypothetical protein D9757_001416 [Collybiopsis confluens]